MTGPKEPLAINREELTKLLIASITNIEDGAGSDLRLAVQHSEWGGVTNWVEVDGNLDVAHLVSDVLLYVEPIVQELRARAWSKGVEDLAVSTLPGSAPLGKNPFV